MPDKDSGLLPQHRKYLIHEALLSSVINSVFTAAAFTILFRHDAVIEIGGLSKFALDFLPHAFFVGLFSVLPPSLITARRVRLGKIPPLLGGRSRLPGSLVLRTGLLALASMVIFGGAGLLTISQLPAQAISFSIGMVIKIGFAVAVSTVITRIAVRAALFPKIK